MAEGEPDPGPTGGGAVAGLQHERTALAWERTAIAMMVAGVVLARTAAESLHYTIGFTGVLQTLAGGLLLAWAGRHDEQLHGFTSPASAIPQLALTRLVGGGAVVSTGLALVLATLIVFVD